MARTHRGSGSGGLPYLLCGPECLGGFDLGVKLLRLEDLRVPVPLEGGHGRPLLGIVVVEDRRPAGG